jgi:hypothetical protein
MVSRRAIKTSVCLQLNRRVRKLYLPVGGRHFWSRHAYELAYVSQRNARADAAPGGANYPYKWYAAPGPNRRGNMCVTHTDALRGYGYQAPCKK